MEDCFILLCNNSDWNYNCQLKRGDICHIKGKLTVVINALIMGIHVIGALFI